MSKQQPPPPIGADIPDEELFKRAPKQEDCPVCFVELPNESVEQSRSYQPCCGQIICGGCQMQTWGVNYSCPFCRAKVGATEVVESLQQRAAQGDPGAMCGLGEEYRKGVCVKKDMKTAMELLHRAADNGSISAHAFLASIYREGDDGVDKSQQKWIHHELAAAMGGHNISRHNIGVIDGSNGHTDRAMKHFIIAASDGYEPALKNVKAGYVGGYVSKDDFAMALRAYQESNDAVKSEQRETGLKMLELMKEIASNPDSAGGKAFEEVLKQVRARAP